MRRARYAAVAVVVAIGLAGGGVVAVAGTVHDDPAAIGHIDAAIAELESARAEITAPPPTVTATVTETPPPVTTTTTATVTAPGPTVTVTTQANAKPGAGNTGVPAGTQLTVVTGNITATAGQVIQNVDLRGRVIVNAPNVTIRNSIIRGTVNAWTSTSSGGLVTATGSAVANLLIERSTLIPLDPDPGWTGIIGHDYTARYNDISNTVDGFGVYNTAAPNTNSNVVIENNWVHDLSWFNPDPWHSDGVHADGVQMQGGLGTRIWFNTLDAKFAPYSVNSFGNPVGTNNQPQQPQAMSALMFNNNVGKASADAQYNWLSGGKITVNAGGVANTDIGTVAHNTFARDYQTKSFVITAGTVVSSPGNVYADDGSAVPVTRW
jgi:hypothetical protein